MSLDWLLRGLGKGPGNFNSPLDCKFDEFLKLYEVSDDRSKAQALRSAIAILSEEPIDTTHSTAFNNSTPSKSRKITAANLTKTSKTLEEVKQGGIMSEENAVEKNSKIFSN
ncbi:hypothetical protein B488_06250 [Liberibacter crescens BT-1]|uniref:Uncharacterized protein n=1 Tax=Liberibacter crescens (strain BT-1) TaxID=1215343 RepID=L0EUI1_LIBCB|nr:hypothetical protein B488_06250 [Liberibacter crescens BT-1]